MDSIKHDWGGQPFRDCLGGVKDILASKPYLDSNRVGALGASYGEQGCTNIYVGSVEHHCIVHGGKLSFVTFSILF